MQKPKSIRFNSANYILVEAASPQGAWEQLQQALLDAEQEQNPANMMKVKKGFLALQDTIGKVALNPKKTRAVEVKKFLDAFIAKTFPVEGANTKMSIQELRTNAFKAYRYFEGASIMDPSGEELGALKPPQMQPAMAAVRMAELDFKGANEHIVKFGDSMLRSMTKVWHGLAAFGGPDRNNPHVMTTKLLVLLDKDTVLDLSNYVDSIAMLLNSTKKLANTIAQTNEHYGPRTPQTKDTKSPNVVNEWQRGGSVIPPEKIQVRGAVYRYVGKFYEKTSTPKSAESLPKETQEKLFNYNRHQNILIGDLQSELRDAWYALRDNMTPKLPRGEVPTDHLIPLVDDSTVKILADLHQKFQKVLNTAKAWQPKIEAFQQQLGSAPANK